MNTTQKVGTGLAAVVASTISLGDTKDAKAQYPLAGCAPRQFTVMQEKTITYPVTTWQQETTMVSRTQWVPQTVMVPETRMVPYTHCETQTIRTPVVYQRVDPCRPRCDIGRGVGQFLEGAISLPFEIIGGVLDCRPRPVFAPRVPYCVPRAFVPVVPAVPYHGCGPCGHR